MAPNQSPRNSAHPTGLSTDSAPVSAHADSWISFAYALDELSAAERTQFEERMATDAQLCEEFLAALKLLNALQTAPPPSPARTAPLRTRRLAVIFPAMAAIAAVAVMAGLLRSTLSPALDSLQDAVAFSSILQLSEPAPEFSPELPDAVNPSTEILETPGWLLTAVDLDEQASTSHTPSPDDDEAIF